MTEQVISKSQHQLRLIRGDALEELPKIDSADLIIADPPYLDKSQVPNIREEIGGCLFGIDYSKIVPEFRRILRGGGFLVLFGHLSTIAKNWPLLTQHFDYVTDIIWVKPQGVNFLKAREKPMSQHETIAVFKTDGAVYNCEEARERGDPYGPRASRQNSFYNVSNFTRGNGGWRYFTNVIKAPNKPCMPKEERTPHPTQKPLYLAEKLIKAFSPPRGRVLDPFMGSGSFGVSAVGLGRVYIDIEKDPEYFKIAEARIRQAAELQRYCQLGPAHYEKEAPVR